MPVRCTVWLSLCSHLSCRSPSYFSAQGLVGGKDSQRQRGWGWGSGDSSPPLPSPPSPSCSLSLTLMGVCLAVSLLCLYLAAVSFSWLAQKNVLQVPCDTGH